MPPDFPELWKKMIARFALGDWSLHGPNHWRNVERNGLQLCRLNGADEMVVRLFALFHDVERQNEGHDPDHGRRGAELVEQLHGRVFTVSDKQMQLLLEACRYHNDGLTSREVSIGTCWDADRMDLPRVGIVPQAEKMSTFHGKDYAVRGPIALSSPPPAI